MRIKRPMIYTAVSAAAIATAGLLATPAFAATTQYPVLGQGISLHNTDGSATGTVTTSGQHGQNGHGRVTVSGTVTDYRSSRYGNRQGTIEEVFLSTDSWSRGKLIGSAGPGQSDRFNGTVSGTDRITITLCAANQWGGKVKDCTSQTITVSAQQNNPRNPPGNH